MNKAKASKGAKSAKQTKTQTARVAPPSGVKPEDLADRLVEGALLVYLRVSKYNGEHRVAELARELAESHQADVSSLAGEVKTLTREQRKPIESAMRALRFGAFWTRTTPWSDDGWRFCPVGLFEDLRKDIAARTAEFRDAVEKLVSKRDELARDYKRRVNGLADLRPFPTAEQLRALFDVRFDFQALHAGDDLRLKGVPKEVAEQIRQQAVDRLVTAHGAVTAELASKVREVVGKLASRLGEKDPTFRNSLVKNIGEAVEEIGRFNVAGDPRIGRILDRMSADLAKLDPEKLRADETERKGAVTVAQSILDDLATFAPSIDA